MIPLALVVLAGAVLSYLVFAIPLRTRTARLAVTADRVPELERERDDFREQQDEARNRVTKLETTLEEEKRTTRPASKS